ncbi:transglutaminase-like domain-containing protein [Lichenicola sp.]|uniref:transglutaminase-like domain-containing protein n=1 Tax=Lichenicola sp. TaxID=2804529 RepID=UPI003AFF6C3A
MQISAGFDIVYDCPHPTPMILLLSPHPSRETDLAAPQEMLFDPPIAHERYLDSFGNVCTRILAPEGRLTISSRMVVSDAGLPDRITPEAQQHPVEELPADTLVYLLGSRYCDTDRMSDRAWHLFGGGPRGWALVQAICDYAHERIVFNYQHADSTRTASDGERDGRGVCRDYAHLAITLCRCMNVPARYCTGFLGDMGTLPPYGVMDFAAWFEVYLGGEWHTFDARNNTPRIGRILIARGRDATDVAIATTFGPCRLSGFDVICTEMAAELVDDSILASAHPS